MGVLGLINPVPKLFLGACLRPGLLQAPLRFGFFVRRKGETKRAKSFASLSQIPANITS